MSTEPAAGRSGVRRRTETALPRLLAAPLALLLTAASVLALAGCTPLRTAADATGAAGASAGTSRPEPVRLVALLPLTGVSGAAGQAMAAAAQMTVDDVNAAGGVLGRAVELDVVDDACDPETAVLAAADALARGVVASVGGYCSRSVLPTITLFGDADVPMVLPAANSTDLLGTGSPDPYLLNPTVRQQAGLAVPWLAGLGADSAAFVHDGSTYSLTLAQSADAVARATGALASAGVLEATQGWADYGDVAAKVVAGGAQAVYYTGFEGDAVRLAGALAVAGFTGTFAVGDGGYGDELAAQAPAMLGRPVYATVPPVAALGDDAQRAWAAELTRRTGSPAPLFTLHAADAVSVVVDAVERAGSTSPDAVQAALAATAGLPGLTGTVSFAGSPVVSGQPLLLVEMSATGTSVLDRREPGP